MFIMRNILAIAAVVVVTPAGAVQAEEAASKRAYELLLSGASYGAHIKSWPTAEAEEEGKCGVFLMFPEKSGVDRGALPRVDFALGEGETIEFSSSADADAATLLCRGGELIPLGK